MIGMSVLMYVFLNLVFFANFIFNVKQMEPVITTTERFLNRYQKDKNIHQRMIAVAILLFVVCLGFTSEGIGIVALIVLFTIHSVYYAPVLVAMIILSVSENILEKIVNELGD